MNKPYGMDHLIPVDDAIPTRIKSRISTLSYGIVVRRLFDPLVHREEDKVDGVDGIARATNQMKWFVERGDHIDGNPITFPLWQLVKSLENLEIVIYGCRYNPPPSRRTDEVFEVCRQRFQMPITVDQLPQKGTVDGQVWHIFSFDVQMRLLGPSVEVTALYNGLMLRQESVGTPTAMREPVDTPITILEPVGTPTAIHEHGSQDLKELIEKALRPSRSWSSFRTSDISTSSNLRRPRRYFILPPTHIRREEPQFLDLGQHASFADFDSSTDVDVSYRIKSRRNDEEDGGMIPGQSNHPAETIPKKGDDVHNATWNLDTGLQTRKSQRHRPRKTVILETESEDENLPTTYSTSLFMAEDDPTVSSSLNQKLYKKLQIGPKQIRILKILAGVSAIVTKLEVEDWDDSIPGHYEALSYSWGDGNCKKTITVNHMKVEVYPNLFHALTCLRSETADRSIWVDALCINQNDWPEKSRELPKMGDIYKRAKKVTIFLGCDLGPSIPLSLSPIATFFEFCCRGQELRRRAVDNISGLEQTCDEAKLDSKSVLEGLVQLGRQEWWTRVWILQEFYLAKKDPEWNWGTKTETGVWKTKTITNSTLRQDMGSMIEALSNSHFLQKVPIPGPSPRIKSLPIIKQLKRNLLLISRGFHIEPDVYDNPEKRYREIWAECKRPHDLIYGLKEIFPPRIGRLIANDYSRAPEEIWAVMVVILLAECHWGDIFWWYPSRLPHQDKLPSWLPDLRYRVLPEDNEIIPDDIVDIEHGSHERRNPTFRIEDQVLHIQGIRVGVIDVIFEIEAHQDIDLVEQLKQFDRHILASDHFCAPYPTMSDASATNSAARLQCHDVFEYVRNSLQDYAKTNFSSQTPGIVENFLQLALEDFVEAAIFDQAVLKTGLLAVVMNTPNHDASNCPGSFHVCYQQRNMNIVNSITSCGNSSEITSLASHLIIVAERLHRLSNQSQQPLANHLLSPTERLACKKLQSLKEVKQDKRRYFFKTDTKLVGVSAPGVVDIKNGDAVVLLDGITFSTIVRAADQGFDGVRMLGCALVKDPESNYILSTKSSYWHARERNRKNFEIL